MHQVLADLMAIEDATAVQSKLLSIPLYDLLSIARSHTKQFAALIYHHHKTLFRSPDLIALFGQPGTNNNPRLVGTTVWLLLAKKQFDFFFAILESLGKEWFFQEVVINAFNQLAGKGMNSYVNTSVWYWLAKDEKTRLPLMTMITEHPKLLENKAVIAAFNALRNRFADADRDTSVWYWLASDKNTRASLMAAITDHPRLLEDATTIAAFGAIKSHSITDTSVWYYLARDSRTRTALITLLIQHPHFLDNPAFITSLSQLTQEWTGYTSYNTSVWHWLAYDSTTLVNLAILVQEKKLIEYRIVREIFSVLSISSDLSPNDQSVKEVNTSIWYRLANNATTLPILMSLITQYPNLLKARHIITAFSTLRNALAGADENTSVWYWLAKNPESRLALMTEIAKQSTLFQNRVVIDAFSALRNKLAETDENTSVWYWLASDTSTHLALTSLFNQYSKILYNPEIFIALSKLSNSVMSKMINSTMWCWFADNEKIRLALMSVMTNHPKFLEEKTVITSLSALRDKSVGIFENTSAWYWLAKNSDSRLHLMNVITQHPELLENKAVVTAFSALRNGLAGKDANTSVWYWLAGNKDSRLLLITAIAKHPKMLEDNAVVAAFSALRNNSAGKDANTSVWYWLAGNNDTQPLLVNVIIKHPKLLEEKTVIAAFSALRNELAGDYQNTSVWYWLAYKPHNMKILLQPSIGTLLPYIIQTLAKKPIENSALWVLLAADPITRPALLSALLEIPLLIKSSGVLNNFNIKFKASLQLGLLFTGSVWDYLIDDADCRAGVIHLLSQHSYLLESNTLKKILSEPLCDMHDGVTNGFPWFYLSDPSLFDQHPEQPFRIGISPEKSVLIEDGKKTLEFTICSPLFPEHKRIQHQFAYLLSQNLSHISSEMANQLLYYLLKNAASIWEYTPSCYQRITTALRTLSRIENYRIPEQWALPLLSFVWFKLKDAALADALYHRLESISEDTQCYHQRIKQRICLVKKTDKLTTEKTQSTAISIFSSNPSLNATAKSSWSSRCQR